MVFSEMFNLSFFVAVLLLILVVSALFAYINYRFTQQDYKMSSMLGLISTMAQEIEFFRNKNQKMDGGSITITPFSKEYTHSNELIEVSDNEDNDEDDDDDDDYDDDDDDDEEPNKLKIFNLNLGNIQQHLDISEEIRGLDEDAEDEDETLASLGSHTVCFNSGPEEKLILDNKSDFLKTVHISDLDEPLDNEYNEYKKMPVNKLRLLAAEKGLCEDPSKLKKNEILKLMECV